MFPSQHKKLRSNSEILEWHLRHHHKSATCYIPFPQPGFLGNNLDERFVLDSNTVLSQIRGVGGEIKGFGSEEGAVDVIEGTERDAVLGEDGEVSIGGIVEDGSGEEASGGGDQRGGSPESAFGVGNETVIENGFGGASNVDGGISVDIDVVA